MKRFSVAVLAVVLSAGLLAGCCGFDPCDPCGGSCGCESSCNPCDTPNPCDPCGDPCGAPAEAAPAADAGGGGSCGEGGSCGGK